MAASRYRFRPRYKALALSAMGIGALLLVAAFALGLEGAGFTFAVASGIVGPALGALYLTSPAWRMEVVVRDDGLEVLSDGDRKFLLPWDEVTRVVASPATHTCYVSGGDADRSLIVPGPGANAPYDLEHKQDLYREILARVPGGVVEEVELLEQAR